jgi:hypothetical protein
MHKQKPGAQLRVQRSIGALAAAFKLHHFCHSSKIGQSRRNLAVLLVLGGVAVQPGGSSVRENRA